jgi:hypothetical protein
MKRDGARRDEAPGEPWIEHTRQREVIKTADWVLDLGPEGGEKRGEIVAEGRRSRWRRSRGPNGRYVKAAYRSLRGAHAARPRKALLSTSDPPSVKSRRGFGKTVAVGP